MTKSAIRRERYLQRRKQYITNGVFGDKYVFVAIVIFGDEIEFVAKSIFWRQIKFVVSNIFGDEYVFFAKDTFDDEIQISRKVYGDRAITMTFATTLFCRQKFFLTKN